MKYIVELQVTPIEQELVMKQCPYGTWRSKNGRDHVVEFETIEEANHFFECVNTHGYPISPVKKITDGHTR